MNAAEAVRHLELLRHPAVRALVEMVHPAECHLVGGALRDGLLGLQVKDIDVVVAGRGREVAERLAAELGAHLVLLGGKEFAAFRLVVAGEYVVDLWDRGETPLERDLARRDFTLNSFALAAATGTLVDPFGGVPDLERRLLRATTEASFSGDPLRVLRLPRLLAQLPGFAAEERTVALARAAAGALGTVAAERVREELALAFRAGEAHRALELLVRLGVYPDLWIGAPAAAGCRDDAARRAVEAVVRLPACAARLRALLPEPEIDLPAARLAITFAALPYVVPGSDSQSALERFRNAGYVTRATADAVRLLLRWDAMPGDDSARRRFLHGAGAAWPTVACFLGARAAMGGRHEAWEPALAPLVELAQREGNELIAPPRLLSGEEIQALLGVGPGPQVGRALAALTAAQVDGRIKTKDEAETLVRGLRAPA